MSDAGGEQQLRPAAAPRSFWARLGLWALWGAGWVALLGAITLIEWQRHRERAAGSTQGAVIRQVWVRELHGEAIEPRLRPVVGFSAPDGRAIEFIAWRRLPPGDTVPVRFDRLNPAAAEVPGPWWEVHGWALLLGLAGIAMALSSAWLRRPLPTAPPP